MPDAITPQDVLLLPNGKSILPDGTILDPSVGMSTEVLNAQDSVVLVKRMQRSLGDLPDVPKNLNPICCVLTYTSLGLDNDNIALALSTTVDNVERLKDSDIYQQLEKMFDERVFEDEQRTARHIISKAAGNAAQRMVGMINSKSGELALAASTKVLQIGGIDKSAQSTGLTKLQIVMVDEESKKRTGIEVTLG